MRELDVRELSCVSGGACPGCHVPGGDVSASGRGDGWQWARNVINAASSWFRGSASGGGGGRGF